MLASSRSARSTAHPTEELERRLEDVGESLEKLIVSTAQATKPEKISEKVTTDGRQVRKLLEEGAGYLRIYSPCKAQSKFEKATKKAAMLRAEIKRALELSGGGAQAFGESLHRELDAMRREKLSSYLGKRFNEIYSERALPPIAERIGETVSKQLESEQVFSEELYTELMGAVKKIFGEELKEDLKAEENFARAVAEKLPPAPQKEGEVEAGEIPKGVPLLSLEARERAVRYAEHTLTGVVERDLKEKRLSLFDPVRREGEDTQRLSLCGKLDNLMNQLAVGRREFLGGLRTTDIAQVHRRFRDGIEGLRRFRGYTEVDIEAYRRFAEAIKGRGQIRGEIFELKGA